MKFSLHLLLLFFANLGCCKLSAALWPQKLGLLSKHLPSKVSVNDGFNIRNYTQTLDHFSYRPESYSTFQQRYAINFMYWGGAKNNSPIFVYTGDEGSLEVDLAAGFVVEAAARFSALVVFIEHRYYGKSFPFKVTDDAPYRNSSTLGYFTSSQALADYAELIILLKKDLSAENCPVIAMGGSYGGMLASWFRMKYPHIVIGALASSAPILYFDDITPQDGYFSVVTRDYREASENCYQTIKRSWAEIDKIASLPNGLNILRLRFMTCRTLDNPDQLKDALVSIFSHFAQYNRPPQYPVRMICKAIDGAMQGVDAIGRIIEGITTVNIGCIDTEGPGEYAKSFGWLWQECSEMVMPLGRRRNDTMFPIKPFDINNFTRDCQSYYGVTPRPHWITTEFGGHNIKTVLEKFASNIIFSNGLQDPYSSAGVLYNISDSIVALTAAKGSHCNDILPSSPSDPEWLVAQRNAEIQIIAGWLAEYYAKS